MDIVDHAKEGQIMKIKENFYIYIYRKLKMLIETKKTEDKKNLFHIGTTQTCTKKFIKHF
jgi:hypothetical protein